MTKLSVVPEASQICSVRVGILMELCLRQLNVTFKSVVCIFVILRHLNMFLMGSIGIIFIYFPQTLPLAELPSCLLVVVKQHVVLCK